MATYQTTGTLTGYIDSDNVPAAQNYLRRDNMTQYVAPNAGLEGVLEFIEWTLHSDGHGYHVTAVTNRELTEAELARLSSEVSGQNSDGLGEGFEQQAFAELEEDEDFEYGGMETTMISFDWETNKSVFTRV